MNVPRDDWFAYRAMHKLKDEYKSESSIDLFLTCYNIDRTRDFQNRAEFHRDKMILDERLPAVSDNHLIDLCNECLTYGNSMALQILIKEVLYRNLSYHEGQRILFFKEGK